MFFLSDVLKQASSSLQAVEHKPRPSQVQCHEHLKRALEHVFSAMNDATTALQAMREQAEREAADQDVLHTQLKALETLTQEKVVAAAEHQAARVKAVGERNKLQQTLIR